MPLYASATPKVSRFPFFYFFLLIYMPVVAIVLGIVLFLQDRLRTPAPSARRTRHRRTGRGAPE